jgi:hypothetical protein
VIHKGKIINTVEYLNTKYKEYNFVSTVKSHESYQANMNSTIKIAAKVVYESNQTKQRDDTKKYTVNKSKIRRVLKK